MFGRKTLAASLAATLSIAFTGLSGAASASTVNISVTGTTIEVDCGGTAAQSCQGIVGGSLTVTNPGNQVTGGSAGALSTSSASLYQVGNASPENEAQALDFLIDGIDNDDFTTGLTTQVAEADSDSLTFLSDAEYLAFKVGKDTFFLQLTGPGIVTISFDKNGQKGNGLSHYTEFGQLAAVPIPAAGLLLIAGLAGLGALRRRKAA